MSNLRIFYGMSFPMLCALSEWLSGDVDDDSLHSYIIDTCREHTGEFTINTTSGSSNDDDF